MLDYQDKQDLKQYLIEKQHQLGNWEFEKSRTFCLTNNLDFKTLLYEVIEWQDTYGNGKANITDKELPWTVL